MCEQRGAESVAADVYTFVGLHMCQQRGPVCVHTKCVCAVSLRAARLRSRHVHDSRVLRVNVRLAALHRERLAGARLSVREHGAVHALADGGNNLAASLFVDVCGGGGLAVRFVVREEGLAVDALLEGGEERPHTWCEQRGRA